MSLIVALSISKRLYAQLDLYVKEIKNSKEKWNCISGSKTQRDNCGRSRDCSMNVKLLFTIVYPGN